MKNYFKSISVRDLFLDLLFTVIGTALVGFALSIFTVPNDIAPGGVSGMATALAFITPIRVSVWTLMMNIPLMVAAWRRLGPRALFYTLIATLLLSFFIEIGARFLPQYTTDHLVASLMGGVVSGLGMGILFVRGSSITIFVCSKVIDTITQGVDYAKVIYTVTEHGEAVVQALNEQTDRGSTLIPAIGGYTGGSKQIVMTVTRRSVVAQTLRIIRQTDPKSFTFVMDSTEVHGEGFRAD